MEEKKRKKNGLWETTEPRYKRFLRYKSVQKWLKDILSEKTKRNYMYLFYKFLRSAQKNPKSLLKLYDKELKETIENYLNKKLEEERRGMVAHTFTVIKSFLASQNRILEWSKNEKRKYSRIGYTRVAKQHVPTKEEIYAMADVASTPRNRAIILCLFQSGVRLNCMNRWDWKLVKDRLFLPETDERSVGRCGYLPLTLSDGYDTKTSSYGVGYFYTFLHEEAAKALRAYLNHRINVDGWEPKDDDKLFVTEGKGDARCGKPLSEMVIYRVVKKCAKSIGLNPDTISTHCFRKAFQKQLIKAGIQETYITHLLGHRPNNSNYAYFDFKDMETIAQEYLKANWNREGTSRLNGLEQENKDLKEKLAMLEKQFKDLEKMVLESVKKP